MLNCARCGEQFQTFEAFTAHKEHGHVLPTHATGRTKAQIVAAVENRLGAVIISRESSHPSTCTCIACHEQKWKEFMNGGKR